MKRKTVSFALITILLGCTVSRQEPAKTLWIVFPLHVSPENVRINFDGENQDMEKKQVIETPIRPGGYLVDWNYKFKNVEQENVQITIFNKVYEINLPPIEERSEIWWIYFTGDNDSTIQQGPTPEYYIR